MLFERLDKYVCSSWCYDMKSKIWLEVQRKNLSIHIRRMDQMFSVKFLQILPMPHLHSFHHFQSKIEVKVLRVLIHPIFSLTSDNKQVNPIKLCVWCHDSGISAYFKEILAQDSLHIDYIDLIVSYSLNILNICKVYAAMVICTDICMCKVTLYKGD